MAFDPDAYLKEQKTTFNPDAYLSKVEKAEPERLQDESFIKQTWGALMKGGMSW